jgi:hypothetical protein
MKTISDHVMDIVQNSVRANATMIEVIFDEDKKNDFYVLKIRDNGCGMSPDVLQKAADPFFTSRNTRSVGLGLSLLKQNAESANGFMKLDSEPGKGTEVTATFQLSHLDRPPLGDIWNVWYLLLVGNPRIRMVYRHKTPKGIFMADSEELAILLNGVSLQQKEIKDAVIEWIKNNLVDIGISK